MDYIIRPLDWEDIGTNGIPYDCFDVMRFFNYALAKNLYPLVPRNNRITEEEIRNIWIPSKDKNITYVAQFTDPSMLNVVGSGTLFVEGNRGDLHVTVDPRFLSMGIGTDITKAIIEEARKRRINVHIETSVHNERARKALSKSGYFPINYNPENPRYKDKITPPANSLTPFATLEYIVMQHRIQKGK